MKKYICPSADIMTFHFEQSLLSSSEISMGGVASSFDTRQYDNNQDDWIEDE